MELWSHIRVDQPLAHLLLQLHVIDLEMDRPQPTKACK